MPFYDLRCISCRREFNTSASIADRTEKKIFCPECGSPDLEAVYKKAPGYIKSRKEPECPNRHLCGAGCHHAG